MPPYAAVFCCFKVRFSARSLLHVSHMRPLVIRRPQPVATISTVLRVGSSSLPCGPYLAIAAPPEAQKPIAATVGDSAAVSIGGTSGAERAGCSCAVADFPALKRELAAASAGSRLDAAVVTLGDTTERRDGRTPDSLSPLASRVGRSPSLETTMGARWRPTAALRGPGQRGDGDPSFRGQELQADR